MAFEFRMLIDGKWMNADGRETLSVTNPATTEEIGRLPCATIEDLDLAAKAARRAFADWSARSPVERQLYLNRAASLIRERVDVIAAALTRDQGKPLAEARGEVLVVADFFQWFGEEGRRIYGRTIPGEDPAVTQTVMQVPVGPVLVFGPWNFPVSEIGGHMAGALAAGCTCILKPAEETPSAPQLIIEAIADAGFPDGVVNLVTGHSPVISEHLLEHEAIRKIAFTGSVRVGKILAQKAAALMKHATMELGGNAPVIVGETADIERAAQLVAARKFRNAGQVCVAPNRIFVHQRRYDEFVSSFLIHVQAIRVGDGSDPETTMGPLVRPHRVSAMNSLLDGSLSAGAELLAGGTLLDGSGNFWRPTVIGNVPDNAPAFEDEIFGPIASIAQFTTTEEVLQRANTASVGLAAYVISNDRREIDLCRKHLQVGCIGINTMFVSNVETPFGGVKDSGYGRVGGVEGIQAYLETRFIAEQI